MPNDPAQQIAECVCSGQMGQAIWTAHMRAHGALWGLSIGLHPQRPNAIRVCFISEGGKGPWNHESQRRDPFGTFGNFVKSEPDLARCYLKSKALTAAALFFLRADVARALRTSVKKGIGRSVMAKQLTDIFERSRGSFQRNQ